MRVRAYGRDLLLVRGSTAWDVFDLGSEGKKRQARDIIIPSAVASHEIVEYLADLLHECATPKHPDVLLLEPGE